MAAKFPLQSLLDLSNLRLDEAARLLGQLVDGELQATERLDLLIQYRDEYHVRFLDAARQGLAPDQWRNYQSFLERLDSAICQARELLAQSRQRKAAGQKEWLDRRGRVKAFDTLAHRHQARAEYAERRLEQKTQDEHSARKHQTKNQDPK